MGFGLPRLNWAYDGIINGLIRIVLSIAFAFSLFTLKTPAGSQFAYLDSPLAIAVVLFILCVSIFLTPYLSMLGGKIWGRMSEFNNKGNRFFSFYFFETTIHIRCVVFSNDRQSLRTN